MEQMRGGLYVRTYRKKIDFPHDVEDVVHLSAIDEAMNGID